MADLPVWGIHITTASVRAVKLERIEGEIRVVAHDQLDFADDIEDVASLDRHLALVHALAVLMKRHDLGRARVMVSVDAATSFNRFLSAPMVENENLMRILAYEAQQQIPFDLDQVHWDHKVLELREGDREADVLLFAIKKELVEERLRRLQKLRFPVDGVQLGPIALYNFAVRERLVRDGQVLVSVDFDRCDVIACLGKRLWFRSLPIGFHPLFKAVAEAYGVGHRQAVKIVRGELEVDDEAELEQARRSVGEKIARELSRMISYFAGAVPELTPRSIVYFPGSPIQVPVVPYLQRLSGLEVHTFKSFRQLPVAMPELSPNLAGLAQAAGLGLQLLGEADIDIKLYPPDLERLITGRRVFWAASIVLLFIMVAAIWMMLDSSRARVEEADVELGKMVREAEGLIEVFNSERRERQLRDDMEPYVTAGRHRLVPAMAADRLLDVLERAQADQDPDQRLYLAALDTRIVAEGGAAAALAESGSRRLELVVGMVDLGGAKAAEDYLRRQIWPRLEASGHFRDLKVKNSFTGVRLSAAPKPQEEGVEYRRRFVMLELSCLYEAGEED
ncbi:MAG: pilus assembly protein PilM [Planctomycetes bacterium]|nr:pilus assembly protein PilM [Planctomycetota bacterium]